jgi:ATP-dependent exoDNAse (exonuclease V) beta subunit
MSDIALTPDQLDAVDVALRHSDACVVAGPGSGKTTVLVEYFRRLVEAGVDPLRILAITFTEKAASNMRKKLATAFSELPSERTKLERAWVSTVHGFCARLLKENAVFAGVDPEFRVLDGTEAWRMQQEAMRDTIDGLLDVGREEMRRLIRAISDSDFTLAALSAYDTMRGAGVGAEQLAAFPVPADGAREAIGETVRALRLGGCDGWSSAQREYLEFVLEAADRVTCAQDPLDALRAIAAFQCNLTKCKRGSPSIDLLKRLRDQIADAQCGQLTSLYHREREPLLELFRRFDALYRERKRLASILDFADLEEFTVRLLTDHPETRARLQRQFEHVLMDEFQDTNGQQARLMELIRPPDRFYAVGDINQSIFGFRHADPEGFTAYRDEIVKRERRLVQLVANFRSRAEILRAVETVTAGAPGIEDRALVAGRKFNDDPAYAVEIVAAAEPEIEAAWVARRIVELGEFAFRDIAVLVRNTEVIPLLTAAFDAAGIPYAVTAGRGFHESREVNDLTHLLGVIANPRDEISLAVVLRSPLVNVSEDALVRLKQTGDSLGGNLWRVDETGFGAEDHGKLERFNARLREWRRRREYATFDRLLLEAIDDCGYAASPNLDKFLGLARAAAGRMSLDEFIAELEIVREENRREADAAPEDAANAVKIMTVHSAKGLEFPVVFVAAMHKGVNAGTPVIGFSRHHGLGARWRNPVSGEDRPDLYLRELKQEWELRGEEEASRLLYVAMTRAEQRLIMSFTLGKRKPANWDKLLVDRLALDLDAPRDEIAAYTSPDGKAWKARVTVVDTAPELLRRANAAEEEIAVAEIDAPTVTEQHDSNATVTELAVFASCPRKYYLKHYLGYRGRAEGMGRRGKLSASELGTQVHALLAGIAVAGAEPEALRMAEVFRRSKLGLRAARASRVEREFDFLMAVEDLVISGQVDLWFEEGGELVIVDYKTDTVTAAEAAGHTKDYALQLRLYAMAVERLVGRAPDRAWLHFLRPDVEVEVTLDESPSEVVREFQRAQSKLDFPLAEGERCQRCEFYRGLCTAGLGDDGSKDAITNWNSSL